MARERPVQPMSVFDRLLDEAPEKGRDDAAPRPVSQRLRAAREAIRRDLEALLNTQQPLGAAAPDLPEIATSLVRFGTPGFHGMGLSTELQQARLARSIEDIIGAFEPRLHGARVEIGEKKAEESRNLHLKISGKILFEGAGQSLVFDSFVDASTRQFSIRPTR